MVVIPVADKTLFLELIVKSHLAWLISPLPLQHVSVVVDPLNSGTLCR
jgi:hypothetical protein